MKTNFKRLIALMVLGLFLFLAFRFIGKLETKIEAKNNIQSLPNIHMVDTDNTDFTNSQLNDDLATVLIYFNSECHYCQEEAKNVQQNLALLKNIQLVFISKEGLEIIWQFSVAYELYKQPNIYFLYDRDGHFFNVVNVPTIPYVLIYNKDKQLLKEQSGQITVKGILKAINNQ